MVLTVASKNAFTIWIGMQIHPECVKFFNEDKVASFCNKEKIKKIINTIGDNLKISPKLPVPGDDNDQRDNVPRFTDLELEAICKYIGDSFIKPHELAHFPTAILEDLLLQIKTVRASSRIPPCSTEAESKVYADSSKRLATKKKKAKKILDGAYQCTVQALPQDDFMPQDFEGAGNPDGIPTQHGNQDLAGLDLFSDLDGSEGLENFLAQLDFDVEPNQETQIDDSEITNQEEV